MKNKILAVALFSATLSFAPAAIADTTDATDTASAFASATAQTPSITVGTGTQASSADSNAPAYDSSQPVSFNMTGLQPNEWAEINTVGPSADENFDNDSSSDDHEKIQADASGNATSSLLTLDANCDGGTTGCYYQVSVTGETSGQTSQSINIFMEKQDSSDEATDSSTANPTMTSSVTDSSTTNTSDTSTSTDTSTPDTTPFANDSSSQHKSSVVPWLIAGILTLAALGGLASYYLSRKKKEEAALAHANTGLEESLSRKPRNNNPTDYHDPRL
ncbi:MAG: hypothetical protein QM632_01410 [Micrococcaceae bacterium]